MLSVLTKILLTNITVESIFKYKSALKQGMDLLVQITIPCVFGKCEELKGI